MLTAPSASRQILTGLESPHARVMLRVVIVAAQLATIFLTWPLWQVRTSPPLLPALALPEGNMGEALVATSLLMLVLPRFGLGLYTATLAYAMLLDQTRMQPQMVSFVLLAAGALPGSGGPLVARTHLIALWGYAGFHKLISPGYFSDVFPWLCEDVLPEFAPRTLFGLALAAALFELLLGLAALLWPRARTVVAATAVLLHAGVLLALSPCGHTWNTSVWPWNGALMVAAAVLIAPWRTNIAADWLAARWPARAAVMVLALSPLGFYCGVVDAYFAHCLYSGNIAKATRYDADGIATNVETWDALNAPLPPEPRVYEQYFRAVGQPGERLVIRDPRWWMEQRGRGEVEIELPGLPNDEWTFDAAADEEPPVYVLP